MTRTFAAACLLALPLTLLPAAAQNDQLSANDKDFVEFAGETDLATVRIAQMAQMHAASSEVKKFAVQLEKFHAADLKKLTGIANITGDVAPNTLDEVHMNAVKSLSKAKGRAFDHMFLKTVVNQHENALVSFKREADHGFNPKLQAYAQATLPQLEAHLRQAKDLDSVTH